MGRNGLEQPRRSNEALKLMEALFTQEVPNFTGNTVTTRDFYFNPKTIQQPHPPCIIGGNTDAAIKRACRLGDGWYGIAKTLDQALSLVKRVRGLEPAEQRATPLELTIGIQWRSTTLEDVDRLSQAGVKRVLPSGLVSRDSLGALRRVHETLISKFQ